jgi:hypothetical protein
MSHVQGDFGVARHKGSSPLTDYYMGAKSQLSWPNSLVVLTTANACTDGGNEVIRPLLGADVTASYQDGAGNVCGVLGCCPEGFFTDANGAAINPIDLTSSYKSALGNAISPVPSMALTRRARKFTYDGVLYTYSEVPIIFALDTVEFRMKMYSTNTANELTVGDQVGFDVAAGTDATSRIIRHHVTVNPSAAVKCAAVSGFDENDDTIVLVRILPAFQQLRTGFRYSAQ